MNDINEPIPFNNILKISILDNHDNYSYMYIDKLFNNLHELNLIRTKHANDILMNVPSTIKKLKLEYIENINLGNYSNLELEYLNIVFTDVDVNELTKPYLLKKLVFDGVNSTINEINLTLFNNIQHLSIMNNNDDLLILNQLKNLNTLILDS